MRLGVLDLGSNSFHLLVADRDPSGHIHHVTRQKINLRLGDIVARSGYFPDEAAKDAVEAVRRLRDVAVRSGAHEVFGAATSAFRDAANGDQLLRRIETETGVTVRLIDGCDEGRLVFEAVQRSLDLTVAPAVCLDLGGGSLEVVVGDAASIQWASSLPLGVVRLKAQLLVEDPPSRIQQQRLREHVASVIARDASPVLRFGPRLMVGAGGTFRSIARMVAGQRNSTIPASINEMTVERDDLLELSDLLLHLSPDERTNLPGVGKRRADLAPAGVLIVIAAMDAFGHDSITVAEWTLKEGLLIDAAAKASDPEWFDPARPLALALRNDVDIEHATRVSTIAARLFDAAEEVSGLTDGDRRLLVRAGLLHEIGRCSGEDAHHKAGARMILQERVDEPSAQRDELASLIRFQNSGAPKASYQPFQSLSPARQQAVTVLQSMLRLADWLADDTVAGEVEASAAGVDIEVPEGYAAAAMWELGQRAQAFERLAGLPVTIIRVPEQLELVANRRT
ncbi:MAG TPA: Ppx/GppA phosphatase family protein [Acidimicrobiales bacterium]|nr:Ppx/GppA phosphatase family protein [Acidimicrobiales bacterium]